jgi:hypothetical protein
VCVPHDTLRETVDALQRSVVRGWEVVHGTSGRGRRCLRGLAGRPVTECGMRGFGLVV